MARLSSFTYLNRTMGLRALAVSAPENPLRRSFSRVGVWRVHRRWNPLRPRIPPRGQGVPPEISARRAPSANSGHGRSPRAVFPFVA
jgi:hypothetical protein